MIQVNADCTKLIYTDICETMVIINLEKEPVEKEFVKRYVWYRLLS